MFKEVGLLENIAYILCMHSTLFVTSILMNVKNIFKQGKISQKNINGYKLQLQFLKRYLKIKKVERKNSLAPLTDEQVTKLEAIGMVWSIRKGKLEKEELYTKYNLDYTKNEYLVKNLPYKELEAKINYLLENNLPLVDNNNNPNELFFMSEANMILKYGITKKELLKCKGKISVFTKIYIRRKLRMYSRRI